ncbi:MAG TPA: hypothetical protein VNB92_07055 [Rubrobacter sp.]|jgi:hypothetical protein|nr:hypothetical protein [Rubrobacter sp.]
MHPRGLSTVLFLATIVLIAGLLTGCGGGDQSGSGSQPDGGSKAEQSKNAPVEQGENAPKKRGKNAPKKKILFGTVTFVNPKTEGFSVRPTIDEQGNKPVAFRLANETSITLGGKEAKLEDMKKGQQAQVEYVERKDRNRARSVRLFEAGGGSQDDQGGKKTG